MWLSAIKLAVSAGSKIYANKQKTKMAMSDAQLCMHLVWPKVKKLTKENFLEARQSDWKDEAVLIIFRRQCNFGVGSRIVTIQQRWTR